MGASREVLEEPESKKKGGFLGSGESQEGTVRYSKTRYPEEKGTHWGRPVVSSTPLMRYSYDGNHVPVGGQSQDVEDEVVVALRCRKASRTTAS
ncbi:hypothetical protein HZH66_002206 [Vespula vulgaris]|uniref:Uncharacterized protein n=1 Tax=Vespula vulgaris TaxID=7454 RepID=A0A834KMQ3_VESVU|nr:hypothetical protein HZH66_002206 [Vespula vulgaris]